MSIHQDIAPTKALRQPRHCVTQDITKASHQPSIYATKASTPGHLRLPCWLLKLFASRIHVRWQWASSSCYVGMHEFVYHKERVSVLYWFWICNCPKLSLLSDDKVEVRGGVQNLCFLMLTGVHYWFCCGFSGFCGSTSSPHRRAGSWLRVTPELQMIHRYSHSHYSWLH